MVMILMTIQWFLEILTSQVIQDQIVHHVMLQIKSAIVEMVMLLECLLLLLVDKFSHWPRKILVLMLFAQDNHTI